MRPHGAGRGDPAAEGQPDPDGAHVRRVGEQRSRHRVHDRQLGLDAAGAGQPGAQLPGVHAALESLPEGLPNVHIGVVSSDLGAGRSSTRRRGAAARRRRRPLPERCRARWAEPAAPYPKPEPVPHRHIGSKHNYAGDIADAFSCIAALGTGGCGFEHQLASVRHALGGDADGVPPENQGFLRDDALLAIVLITDEDDCSAPDGHRPLRPEPDAGDRSARAARRPTAATSSATCATARRRRALRRRRICRTARRTRTAS